MRNERREPAPRRQARRMSFGCAVVLAVAGPVRAAEPAGSEDETPASAVEDKAPKKAPVKWSPGRGFTLQTADGKASLNLGAYVQPLVLFAGLGGEVEPEALLRRVRTSIEGDLPYGFSAAVELAFDGGKFELQDAHGTFRAAPWLEVTAGRFKPPSGLEREGSPADQPFIERSAVSDLSADRNVGLRVSGGAASKRVRYALAVVRVPEGNDPALDPGGTDVLARVTVRPFDAVAFSVRGGLLSRPDGASGQAGRDPFGEVFFEAPVQSGLAQQAGADVSIRLPHVRVVAEGALLREGLTAGTDDGHVVDVGGYLLVGVLPFGDRGDVEDGAPFRKGLEVTARLEGVRYMPAPGGGDPATLTGLSVGLTGGPSRSARLQAELWTGWYGDGAARDLAGARRTTLQLWALFRL